MMIDIKQFNMKSIRLFWKIVSRYKTIQYEKYKIVLEDCELRNKKVIDSGCGTGLFLDFIITHVENMNFHYVGTDISIEMLKNFDLKLNGKDSYIKRRVNLLLADLENLPVRKNIFDSIFSLTSLQNLPDIAESIKETIRVVKNRADVRISILRKKLDLRHFLSLLKPIISEIVVFNNEKIEDVIVQGKALKI
jgi:ubiquinone/menaquinone biosynthesis C-methylase UbiE